MRTDIRCHKFREFGRGPIAEISGLTRTERGPKGPVFVLRIANTTGLIACCCQGPSSGFFFREMFGVKPPLLSLTIFSIVHTFNFSRMINPKRPKRTVPPSSTKKSNIKRPRTIKSPEDLGEKKMVKSYTGPAVVPVPPPPDPRCGPGGSDDGRVAVGGGAEELSGGGRGACVGVPELPPSSSCSSSSAASSPSSTVVHQVGLMTTTARSTFPLTNALP